MGSFLLFIAQVPFLCAVIVLLRYFSVLPILELQTVGRAQTYKFNNYKNSFYSFIIALSVVNYTLSEVGSSDSFILWTTFVTGISSVALFEYVICAPNSYDYSVVGKKQFSLDDTISYMKEKLCRLRNLLSDEYTYSTLEYPRQLEYAKQIENEKDLSMLKVARVEHCKILADQQKQIDKNNAEIKFDLVSMGEKIENCKKNNDTPFVGLNVELKKYEDHYGPLKAVNKSCDIEDLNKMSVEKSIELKHFYDLKEKHITIPWDHMNTNRSHSKIELIIFIMQSFNYDINSKKNKVIVEIANYYFIIIEDGERITVRSADVNKAKKKLRRNS